MKRIFIYITVEQKNPLLFVDYFHFNGLFVLFSRIMKMRNHYSFFIIEIFFVSQSF